MIANILVRHNVGTQHGDAKTQVGRGISLGTPQADHEHRLVQKTRVGGEVKQTIFKADNWWVTQAPLNTQTIGASSMTSHFNLHEPCDHYAMSEECSDNERSESEYGKIEAFQCTRILHSNFLKIMQQLLRES